MDAHSKKKELKKLIKNQEKLKIENVAKFDAKRLANYEEQLEIVEKLIDNEEQTNALRSEHIDNLKGDDKHGMDENRHLEDKMNDLGQAHRRLMDKLLPLENIFDK